MCWLCYSALWEIADRRYNPEYYKQVERNRQPRRKEKQKLYRKRMYPQKREIILTKRRQYVRDHPDRIRLSAVKVKHNRKQEFFDMLGSRCVCDGSDCWHLDCCGIEHPWILNADHKNGDGSEDKKRFADATTMRRYYLKHPEEAKEKLQVLCIMCNWFKMFKNKEFNQYRRKQIVVTPSLV